MRSYFYGIFSPYSFMISTTIQTMLSPLSVFLCALSTDRISISWKALLLFLIPGTASLVFLFTSFQSSFNRFTIFNFYHCSNFFFLMDWCIDLIVRTLHRSHIGHFFLQKSAINPYKIYELSASHLFSKWYISVPIFYFFFQNILFWKKFLCGSFNFIHCFFQIRPGKIFDSIPFFVISGSGFRIIHAD